MSLAPLRGLGTVGPYELIHPLGAGGMAETFLAIKRGPAGFEQKVCVKRILAGYTGDTTFVELFLDEARLLANMRCANIVQVYDFGEADGTYYMALELVDGGDLAGLLHWLTSTGRQLSSEAALWIAGQLLRALQYAHTLESDGEPMHIVHRDVSPSNLLVSRAGEVKLTDFGIAKSTKRSHKTRTGHTKGKLAYMSPEQVQGKALDARSDLFSTGILLYELLTGVHPFETTTDLEMLNNIMSGRFTSLSELAPGQPKELIDLVHALLAPAVDARPPSAADALDRLAAIPSSIRAQEDLASMVREFREAKPLPSAERGSDPRSGVRMGSSDGELEVRSGHTVALDSSQRLDASRALQTTNTMPGMESPRTNRTGLRIALVVTLLGALGSLAAYLWLGGAPASDTATEASAQPTAPGPVTPPEPVEEPTTAQQPTPAAAADEGDKDGSTAPEFANPAPGEEIILNQPGAAERPLRAPQAPPPRRAERNERDDRDERPRSARRDRRRAKKQATRESAKEDQGPEPEASPAPTKAPRPSPVPGRSGAQMSADDF